MSKTDFLLLQVRFNVAVYKIFKYLNRIQAIFTLA